MAAGKFNMQKASGGVASITIADGVSNTAVVLPESGTVTTTQYVDARVNEAVAPKANTADLKEIGVGQTWQNVIGSRILNVTYTNSTNKPIMVIITRMVHNSATPYTSYFTIDGTQRTDDSSGGIPSYDNNVSCSYIIPRGSTYKASGSAGVLEWHELI